MRYQAAHRMAWACAGALAVVVVAVKWTSGEFDWGWMVRATLIVATSALLAIGFALRQRAVKEPYIDAILAEREERLYRETESSH